MEGASEDGDPTLYARPVKALAERMACKKRNASFHLARLQRVGLVVRFGRVGSVAQYLVVDPIAWAAANKGRGPEPLIVKDDA